MWPSFNAALSTYDGRLRAIPNTFLSLTGALVATFLISAVLSHKFDMVTVQNSTLAGGMESCAFVLPAVMPARC